MGWAEFWRLGVAPHVAEVLLGAFSESVGQGGHVHPFLELLDDGLHSAGDRPFSQHSWAGARGGGQ